MTAPKRMPRPQLLSRPPRSRHVRGPAFQPARARLIETLCAIVAQEGMTRSGLARAAGVPDRYLRGLGDADWAPGAETLAKLETYLARRAVGIARASPEEIINDARNGRMFILVDDEDRENEGDLVIPAQMATPDAINFMATHGRGLICLALTRQRTDQLGLQLMSATNRTRHETAFTVSIEARHGVTTGISAADRARTVSVAIDAAMGGDDIVTPGHVFPLVARDGGVLIRTGHTEAAVDVARLAGLNPSGVICEIMNDDGTMARLGDLIPFAQRHGLKIGTIRDLVAYRRRHDHLFERRAETRFISHWGGEWSAITFRNKATGTEQIALQKGHVVAGQPTLVRMHQVAPMFDMLGQEGASRTLLARSMAMIAREGSGLIVLLDHQTPLILGESDREDACNYGVGAQILAELNVRDVVLLADPHHSPAVMGPAVMGPAVLDGYDFTVVGVRPVETQANPVMPGAADCGAEFCDKASRG